MSAEFVQLGLGESLELT